MKFPTWRRIKPSKATAGVEFFTAVVTAAVVLAGVFHHFFDGGSGQRSYPGEGRRIVAFRQLANRICKENTDNMERAVDQAKSPSQRVFFLYRAAGWDVHDLTTVTPPPRMIEDFLDELALRRHARADLRHLVAATHRHKKSAQAKIAADLRHTEAGSAEVSGTLGLAKCMRILPLESLNVSTRRAQ